MKLKMLKEVILKAVRKKKKDKLQTKEELFNLQEISH